MGLLMARQDLYKMSGPVCQKASKDYKSITISNKTGTYICKQLGYDTLQEVRLVEDNPWYWFAAYASSFLYDINCEDKKCSFNTQTYGCLDQGDEQYYVTMSCGCTDGRVVTGNGCNECPSDGAIDKQTGLCKYNRNEL